jgi:hypothetical protein
MSEQRRDPEPWGNLGQPLESFPLRPGLRGRNLAVLLLGVAGFLLAAALAAYRWWSAIHNYGPALAGRWISPPVWVAGLMALVAMLGAGLHLAQRRIRAVLCEGGLLLSKPGKVSALHWEEILHIHTRSVEYGALGISWGKHTQVSLITRSGKRISLDDKISDLGRLVASIKERVYPSLMQHYRLAFNRGEVLDFGPLVLTQGGVVLGNQTLAWDHVGQVTLSDGKLRLLPLDRERKEAISIAAHRVPNVDLCAQLIRLLGAHT